MWILPFPFEALYMKVIIASYFNTAVLSIIYPPTTVMLKSHTVSIARDVYPNKELLLEKFQPSYTSCSSWNSYLVCSTCTG